MLGENLTDAAICPLNLGTKERQLRNSDLAMTYYLMFSGYGIAAMIFSTEVNYLTTLIVFLTTMVTTYGEKMNFLLSVVCITFFFNFESRSSRNYI